MAKKKKKRVQKPVAEVNSKLANNEEVLEYNALNTTLPYSKIDFNKSFLYHDSDVFDHFSRQQIEDIIRQPMANNHLLRELSKMLYSSNGIYTHTVDYIEAMPSLQYVLHAEGKAESTKAKNKKLFQEALNAINHKGVIHDALRRAMIEGVAFYYCESESMPTQYNKFMTDFDMNDCMFELNEAGLNISIIPLPTDYTRIHHIENGHYVLAFNMRYFLTGTEPIEKKLRKFPKEIRDGYRDWISGRNEECGDWLILDGNKTIVHKIRSDFREPWGRPLCLAAISDILYADYFTDTKRNVLNGINNEVWIQTFPESEVKGQTTLTKKQQKDQHDTVSRSIKNKDGKNDKTVISLMAGTKIDHVAATNTDILDEKYESDLDDKIAMYLGIAGNLLGGTASGKYSAQSSNLNMLSSQLFEWIDNIARELNKCLNHALIKTKNYRVEVFYLPMTFANQKESIGYFKELYTLGKGPITLWAASCGIPADIFIDLIKEENEVIDWNNPKKFPVHQTAYNSSGDDSDGEAGRPETDNPTDSTLANRDSGGNEIPTPSD